jgi:hypothetical protein
MSAGTSLLREVLGWRHHPHPVGERTTAMAPRVEHALAPPTMNTSEWSEQYAAALRAQLAVLAPNLDVLIQRDAIGLTISGAGWAIHAVHSEPNDERYLSLMSMRGMQTSSFEFAIRHLCLAMAANPRCHQPEHVLGD